MSRFLCLVILPVLSTLVVSAPHNDILCVAQALESLGFKGVSSKDGFERSLTCESCCVTLNYGKKCHAIWVLSRHAEENTHKIKAGWFLDKDNNVKDAKPKGEDNHLAFNL